MYTRNAAHKMSKVPDFSDNKPCGCSIEYNFRTPTYASYYTQSKVPSLLILLAIYLNIAYEGKEVSASTVQSVYIVTGGLRAWWPKNEDWFPEEIETFLFTTASRLAVESTQPILRITGALTLVVGQP